MTRYLWVDKALAFLGFPDPLKRRPIEDLFGDTVITSFYKRHNISTIGKFSNKYRSGKLPIPYPENEYKPDIENIASTYNLG